MFDKGDYKQAASTGTFLGCNIIVWAIFFVVLSIAVTSAYLIYEKWYQNRLTDITRQTNQYVTTQQTSLTTWADEYLDNQTKIAETSNVSLKEALASQNIALCERMRMTAQRIDQDYVPQSAALILQGGCR